MRPCGFLALAILAARQFEPELPGDDPGTRDPDIEDALAALPDARVLDDADDGVPRFLIGSLARGDHAGSGGETCSERDMQVANNEGVK